ncbi:hypothetical protein E1285_13255 [Actinomadura sp. 7K507]|nr:hypothetical protein E1285_13255 [Actinomadura sp. 7K507]
MERQAVLRKTDPPWVFLLVREAVIRDIQRDFRVEQCKRFLDVMAYPNVAVQIVPADAPVFQESGFQLLSFDQAADVAYVDGASGFGQILTDPRDVRRLTVVFDVIRTVALPARASENLIRTIMEDT